MSKGPRSSSSRLLLFGEHKVMDQTDVHTEITGKNFEGWPPELIEESKRANTNGRVGTKLLLESHVTRIWVIELKPGERLPFHRHVLKYFSDRSDSRNGAFPYT